MSQLAQNVTAANNAFSVKSEPKQMTVRDLIKELMDYDLDAPVCLSVIGSDPVAVLATDEIAEGDKDQDTYVLIADRSAKK
jgi:hypothetical protein